MKPLFQLEINSKDVTDLVADRLLSFSISDKEGMESDKLKFKLDNRGFVLPIPAHNEPVRVWLGFNKPEYMGAYTVNDSVLSGRPHTISVDCNAADMGKSLKTIKTRSWHQKTLGEIHADIAKEHDLVPAISDELAVIYFSHVNQTAESDMHLLTRLVRQYDGMIKPTNNMLVCAVIGEAKSVSGKAMPSITLNESDLKAGWTLKNEARPFYKSVVCEYRDIKNAKTKKVTVGSGEPKLKLKEKAGSKEQAKQRANAAKRKMKRKGLKFSFTTAIGDPRISSGAKLLLGDGFHPDYDNNVEMVFKNITHDFNGAYTTKGNAELSN